MLLIWLRCTSPQVRGLNGRSPAIEACELAPSQNCLRGLSIAQWVIFVERRWVNGDERQGAAEKFADEGLGRIRSGIDPSGNDLWMLSREGWAMLLASGLKQARLSGPGKPLDAINAELGLFDGRWKQLDRLKCNPGPELDDLRLRRKR